MRVLTRSIVGGLLVLAVAATGMPHAGASVVIKECMPDFDQFQGDWSELMCGPVATANSFCYLARRYPSLLGDLIKKPDKTAYADNKSFIEDIAQAMTGNRDFANFPGVTLEEMAAGKAKFARERVGDNLVVKPPSEWDAKLVEDGPSTRIKSLTKGPDIQWLRRQLDLCEDVEIAIASVSSTSDGRWWVGESHIASVAGYDNTQIILNDPNSKRASTPVKTTTSQKDYFGQTTTAVSEYFNTEIVTVKGVDMYALKGYGTAPGETWVIIGGIAESPTPEPSALVVWAVLGTIVLGAGRRRRREKSG